MSQGNNAKREGAKSNELYQLQALNRIKDAITGIGQPPAPAGIASEATLQTLVTAVESMRDYEVRLVTDSDSPEVTWLEVRYWDVQTGTLAAPQYYLPGSSTPGTPTGGISYIPTSTLLTQIRTELIAVNAELDAIKLDTAAIDANTDGIEGLLTTIDAVLDTIKTDTASIAAEDFATQTTLALVKTVLDTIKTDSAAMVIDLAAIEALLTTIDTDTSAIAVDIAAIEVELLDQGTSLDAMVTDLAAIETELLDQGTVLDTIDADTSTLATPVANLPVSLIETSTSGTVAAGKRSVSFLNNGAAAADIAGGTDNLAPGVEVTFSAEGLRDTLASIAYDGTGTTLIISTVG